MPDWATPDGGQARPSGDFSVRRSTLALPTYLLVLTALVASVGCRTKLERLRPLVLLEYVDDAPIRFGDVRDVRVTVVNSTIQPILLRSLEMENQLPFAIELQRSFDGDLRYRKGLDVFDFFPGLARRTTPRVMADDTLLLPGEQTTFGDILIRTLVPRQKLTVRYQEMQISTLLRSVYFPVANRVRRSRQRYVIVSYSGLRDYRTGTHEALNRTVVVPNVSELGPIVSSETDFEIPIVDPTIRRKIVSASGAHHNSTVTRWNEKDIWIVDDPAADKTFGFRPAGNSNQAGKRLLLPRCDLEVFDLLEGLSSDGAAMVIQEDGEHLYLTSVEAATRFLEHAQKEGTRLEVESFEDEDELPTSVIAAYSSAKADSEVTEEQPPDSP